MLDPAPAPVPDDWYRRSFGGDYLRVYRRRSEEAAREEAGFAVGKLGLRSGERVLDLACGAGRHSAPLAAAGLRVIGLDLSRPLLTEARAKLGPGVPLVVADMRHLPFAPVFQAVVSFFTSFGYFAGTEDDERVIAEIARVVVPGGGLLLDLPDRDATIDRLIPASKREEDGLQIEERRWLTSDRLRVEKEIRVRSPGGSGEKRYHESVRLYSHDEIEGLLSKAGWQLVSVYGDFSGARWRAGEGPRMMMVARREDPR